MKSSMYVMLMFFVACGGGSGGSAELTFVAGGHAGNVSTIDGGNTWRSGPLSGFHGIAYGDDKFVAVARGGEIYSTP